MNEFNEIAKKIREIFDNDNYDNIEIVYVLAHSESKEIKLGGNGCALCAKDDLELAIKKLKLTHNNPNKNVM